MGKKNKKNAPPQGIDKKWLWLGGAMIATALLAVVVVLLVQPPVPDPVVARFNGTRINASDIAFRFHHAEEVLWHQHDGTTLIVEDTIRQEAVRMAAMDIVFADFAAQNGIALSAHDLAVISDEIDVWIVEVGREIFNETLRADRIRNQRHVEEIFQAQDLMMVIIDTIMHDPALFAQFEAFMPEEIIIDEYPLGAKHILAHFENFDTEEEAEAFAEEKLARALAGEDFDMLVQTYGQDPGMWNNPDGYTFVTGVMVDEFYEATMALQIGEISGLVRSDFGFHIIKRVEPNLDAIDRPWWEPQPLTLEERQMIAIEAGFEAKLHAGNLEFLPALSDIMVY